MQRRESPLYQDASCGRECLLHLKWEVYDVGCAREEEDVGLRLEEDDEGARPDLDSGRCRIGWGSRIRGRLGALGEEALREGRRTVCCRALGRS